ncbi:MAG: hypothetical protein ACOY5R_07685 [Pseudomonadota bacterium]
MRMDCMTRSRFTAGMIIALSMTAMPFSGAHAQSVMPSTQVSAGAGIRQLSYADFADLALSAQVVAGVTITKAERLKGDLAPGLQAGHARFLIEAQTAMLLRGAEGLPGTVSYIVDLPLDDRGRAPKLKKNRVVVFGNRVPQRPQELRLTSPYSQVDWTQGTESLLRSILTEATAPTAPPVIKGVGNAFHVPGAIPGESESQIFLTTPNDRPISLTILRRPGEQPQWAVALGEMVDDSASAPAPNSLLWYRLSCFLPSAMPERSTTSLGAADAQAVREDYAFVLKQLGPCGRTIAR